MEVKLNKADVAGLSAEIDKLSEQARKIVTALAAAASVVPDGNGAGGGQNVLITVKTDHMPSIADVLNRGYTPGQSLNVKANKVGKQLSVEFTP